MSNVLTANPQVSEICQSVQNSYAELQQIIADQLTRLPSAKLYQPPAPDEWSVMQILAHMTEIMPYWGSQIEKLVAQPGQNFGRVMTDPDRVRYIQEHGHDTLVATQAALPPAYERLQQVLGSLKDTDLALTGVHSRFGERPLEWFVAEFVTDHLKNHLTQLRECLAVI